MYFLPSILKLAAVAYCSHRPEAPVTALMSPLARARANQAAPRPSFSQAHTALTRVALLLQTALWTYVLAAGGATEADALGVMVASQLSVDLCGAVGAVTLPVGGSEH